LILLRLLFLLSFIFWPSVNNLETENCLILVEEKIVCDTSLTPYINPGVKIKTLLNYYDCHEIERGDLVLFNYSGNSNPLLKVVKGIPGDKFNLRETRKGWNILINDEIVKNFECKPYFILGNKYKMLSLYEKDYGSVIPENTYLLLGNQVSGSMDSTRFGLIDRSNIVAKVVY
jgi:signal peptidase I